MKELLPDSCPRCLSIGYPHTLRYDQGSILALYICQRCRRHWRSWYNPDCLEVSSRDLDSLSVQPC
jgi:hypothetical protein